MESVGIVGLGLIGGSLVGRLVENGLTPRVFDLNPEAVDWAIEAGGIPVDSSKELAQQCELMLVCVQTDQQCVDAIRGDGGLLEGAKPGSCIAVLSTVVPSTIFSLAEAAADRGVDLVDTPVAGRGMYSVKEGTMSVLVGNQGPLVTRLEPIMRLFASSIISAGPLGSGAALKLAHNVVVYAGFEAMIEAIQLARAAGVGEGLVEQVTKASGALSELSAFFYTHRRDKSPVPHQDDALRVAAQLLDKDLSDAVELARTFGIRLPIAELLSHAGRDVFEV